MPSITTVMLPDLIVRGIAEAPDGPRWERLMTHGVVRAAEALRPTGISPAVIVQLSEVARAAGVRPLAELADPVRQPRAARYLRLWLRAAAQRPALLATDEAFADWLRAVALILAVDPEPDQTGQ
jgi:hypothetical protein